MKRNVLFLVSCMAFLMLVMGCPTITPEPKLPESTIIFADSAAVTKIIGSGNYTNIVSGVGDGAITYSSGTLATATVNVNTGEVTLVAAGTTVITASKAATATHSAVSASYTLTVLPTFTVTYHEATSDSGTAPVDTGKYISGATVTILQNTGNLTKTAYELVGWNTSSNLAGSTYAPGQGFSMGASDVNFYPLWNTVVYDGNGNTSGYVPVEENEYMTGQTVTIKSNSGNLGKTGYVFAGWYSNSTGTGGTAYAVSSTLTKVAGIVTIYARWVPAVKSVSIGGLHAMIVTTSNELYSTGLNTNGQHADKTTSAKTIPVKIMGDVVSTFAKGYNANPGDRSSSMFLMSDSSLLSVGYNGNGELGTGNTTLTTNPVQIMTNIKSAAMSNHYSMFVKSNGTLWATGDNRNGQHADGTTDSKTSPTQIMTNVDSVAVSSSHYFYGNCFTMIVKNDGTLWACGYNDYGQLGTENTTNQPIPLKVMSDVAMVSLGNSHTLILKKDGTLWVCGYNGYGQLGTGNTTSVSTPVQIMSNVSFVEAGTSSSYAIKKDGTLWVWGRSDYGQLGIGGTPSYLSNETNPVQLMTDVKSVVSSNTLTLEYDYTYILKTDGTLWSCGSNEAGQLGDGTTTRRFSPVQIIF